jgi:membrane protease YdiL (CAAX protease family)
MTIKTLIPFLAITFSLTWGLALAFLLFSDAITGIFGPLSMTNPLFLLAVYAPGIAAITLVIRETGFDGLGRFLGRLRLWKCHPGWYAFIFLGIPLLMVAGAILKGSLGTYVFPFSTWPQIITGLGIAMVVGPVEELGWRGVVLPLLQHRFAPIYSSLILGVIWGVWHIPAFVLSGTPQSGWSFLPFFLALISASVIMTALFNASRGSLLLAVLVHFQLNNPIFPDAQPFDSITFTIAALLIVWFYRKALFGISESVKEVVPENKSRSFQ